MQLKYFNVIGRGEAIRILLHAAKLDFKDVTVGFSDWESVKPTTPLGKLPTLTMNGTDFCQSCALMRFAAKKANIMYPSDPFQAFLVDEALDCVEEAMMLYPSSTGDKEGDKKKQEAYQQDTLKRYATLIDSRILKFGNGVSVCSSANIADLSLKFFVEGIEAGFYPNLDTEFFKPYSGIKGCIARISQDPIVVAYYAAKKTKLHNF